MLTYLILIQEAIKIVPEDKLLLESDWNDCLPQPEGMHDILEMVAEIRGWSLEHTAKLTTENSLRFFGL